MHDEIDVDVCPGYPVSWQAAALNTVMRGTLKPVSGLLLRTDTGVLAASQLVALATRVPFRLPDHVRLAQDRVGECSGEWIRAGQGLDGEDASGFAGAAGDGGGGRGPAGRGVVEQEVAGQGGAGRGAVERGTAGYGVAGQGGAGSGVAGGETAGGGAEEFDESRVVLYFHGGGYFICSPATHRPITWRLSAAAGCPVLALDYRQGPVHTPVESLQDAIAAYLCLLERGYDPARIVFAGDSAGGHLTLATLLALRDRNLPRPSAAVCLSPWADLTDGPRRVNRLLDPLIPAGRVGWLARRWTIGLDARDPLVSPVFGDYTGLPPLMVVTGSTEVLRDEGRRVAERARAGGVPVRYEEWRRMPHVFALLADLVPEARQVFWHIARFLTATRALAASAGQGRPERSERAAGEPLTGPGSAAA
ncbi:alpha/beta hydrolase [Streptosporangium sp. NPDC006007]|uniref:alpha/beta hydrolase n=1 Tax=Streptosporangium sp. NPDC006007 TaxID=3154575 RepID=UPI0033A88702